MTSGGTDFRSHPLKTFSIRSFAYGRTSHIRTVLSIALESTWFPSGLNFSPVTVSTCPCISNMCQLNSDDVCQKVQEHDLHCKGNIFSAKIPDFDLVVQACGDDLVWVGSVGYGSNLVLVAK